MRLRIGSDHAPLLNYEAYALAKPNRTGREMAAASY